MLAVEEGRARDAGADRAMAGAAPADRAARDQRVEGRSGPPIARAVARRGDLDHDAGIDRAVGALSQLDVPVAILLHLVHAPDPAGEAVHLELGARARRAAILRPEVRRDRKSTRLNSSHTVISYAVFCLKKKKKTK